MTTKIHRTIARRIAYGISFLVVAGVPAGNEHMRDVALLGHQARCLRRPCH